MPSVAYSTDLSNTSLPTLQGSSLDISIDANGAVFVDGARVINTDILIANGVIHVIDAVLNPETEDPQAGEPGIPTAAASVVPFTSGVQPQTSIYSELSVTTSFVAAGLVSATPTASSGPAGNVSASATASGVVQQTGNAGVKKELPFFAAAVAVGAVALGMDL